MQNKSTKNTKTNQKTEQTVNTATPKTQKIIIKHHPSIYRSINPLSSMIRSQGQQCKQRCPDYSLFSLLHQLLHGDTQVLLDQMRDIISSSSPWSALGFSPHWTSPKHHLMKASRRHPNQIPKPCHLAPLMQRSSDS